MANSAYEPGGFLHFQRHNKHPASSCFRVLLCFVARVLSLFQLLSIGAVNSSLYLSIVTTIQPNQSRPDLASFLNSRTKVPTYTAFVHTNMEQHASHMAYLKSPHPDDLTFTNDVVDPSAL